MRLEGAKARVRKFTLLEFSSNRFQLNAENQTVNSDLWFPQRIFYIFMQKCFIVAVLGIFYPIAVKLYES